MSGGRQDDLSPREVGLGRNVSSTRTGLHLRPGLPFEEWARLGHRVHAVNDASAWWIGDWLVYGQQQFGERYREATAATGFEYQTLRNYAWVAARIPPSRRLDSLSFGHHAEVASLPDKEQDAWLTRAFASQWSRNELRRQLREQRLRASDGRVSLALAIPPHRLDTWRAAALAEALELREWIHHALDKAAESALISTGKPATQGAADG